MKNRKKKPEDNKLVGASVFPVELFKPDDRPLTSLHPWACSLRTRGFRGRHRCGVTLLSGEFQRFFYKLENIEAVNMKA